MDFPLDEGTFELVAQDLMTRDRYTSLFLVIKSYVVDKDQQCHHSLVQHPFCNFPEH